MKILNLIQGSPEWHEHRSNQNILNASDAPAMMDCSEYVTYDELLHIYATGERPPENPAMEHIFAKGHHFEALCRPLAESILGEELWPLTGVNGELSASFDGVTDALKDTFEHKMLNKKLRAVTCIEELPLQYKVQMEVQFMVSGAKKCLFMASDWDKDDNFLEKIQFTYHADEILQERIKKAWELFKLNIKNYAPKEVKKVAMAEAIIGLPSLFVTAKGEVTTSNMPQFGQATSVFLAKINTNLVSDDDFATAKAIAATCRDTFDKLALTQEGMLAQTVTLGDAMRQIDDWKQQYRAKALELENMVKFETARRRAEIEQEHKSLFASYKSEQQKKLTLVRIPEIDLKLTQAMNGKKSIKGWQDAASAALRAAKSELDAIVERVGNNLTGLRLLNEQAEIMFLFSDLQVIAFREPEEFSMLVTSRVAVHEARKEAEKLSEKHISEPAIKSQEAEVLPPTVSVSVSIQDVKIPSRVELINIIADAKGVSISVARDWLRHHFNNDTV
jgi:predicted phage-related endonuclease